jgi:hypothetical protein
VKNCIKDFVVCLVPYWSWGIRADFPGIYGGQWEVRTNAWKKKIVKIEIYGLARAYKGLFSINKLPWLLWR